MILYNKRNTYSSRNHVVTAHKRIFHTFFLTWVGNLRLWLVMMTPPLREVWRPLYHIRKLEMISHLAQVQWKIILQEKSYGPNHPNQMEHEDHLVMMLSHSYTPMLMVEGRALCSMSPHLDTQNLPITRSKLTNSLIHHKLNRAETYVSSLLDVVCCVVISYYLWMSKTTQEIFSMIAHYTCYHVREHAYIGMPITTSTDGEILAIPVGNVINQFNLG